MLRILTLLIGLFIATPAQAQFTYATERDDFTDAFYELVSAHDQRTGQVELAAVCSDGTLLFFVDIGTYFAGDEDDDIRARYRFDDGPISEEFWWSEIGDELWVAAYRGHDDMLLDKMKTHRTMLIELTDPYDGERIVARFNLSGFTRGINRINNCDL